MIVEVNVPVFAESITEGTLLAWHKKIGEAVARDEILVDIETDKVVLEVPAPQAGVLVEIIVNEGDTVTSQQVWPKSIPKPQPFLQLPPKRRLPPKPPRLPSLPMHRPVSPCLPQPNWLPKKAWMSAASKARAATAAY